MTGSSAIIYHHARKFKAGEYSTHRQTGQDGISYQLLWQDMLPLPGIRQEAYTPAIWQGDPFGG